MRRIVPAHLGMKLLILGLCCAVLLLWVWMGWPCVFRSVFGIICPGCGMGRAWLAALRLDLGAAFAHHPMFWSIPVLIVMGMYDGQPFSQKWLNRAIFILLLGGIGVCYALRLAAFLKG